MNTKFSLPLIPLLFACFALSPSIQAVPPNPFDVNVLNTPTVNVATMPPVQVDSSATNPVRVRDVENPALQPYQDVDLSGVTSPNGFIKTASFDVPAGKRLVIELITIWAAVEAGQTISDAAVRITKQGAEALDFHLTPMAIGTSAGCPGCGVFVITQPLQLYCDAGTGALQVRTERTGSTGLYSTRFSVSGYLIDLP